MASGWMQIRQRAKQSGVEMPLILSDHADWNDLLTTIDEVAPAEVWVTHGREEALIRALALKGIRGGRCRSSAMRMKPNEAFCQFARTAALCPQRNTKLAWLGSWLENCPREIGAGALPHLSAILILGRVKAGVVRKLAAAAIDEELFAQSYDFVGDLAETTH